MKYAKIRIKRLSSHDTNNNYNYSVSETMPKRTATNDIAKKGEKLVSQPIMGEDTSLDSIPAEANLAARSATKPLVGEVDGLVLEEEKAAKFKIPSKVGSTKSLKGEEVVVYDGSSKYSGRKTDHKGQKPECKTKSSKNAKKQKRNDDVADSVRAAVKEEVKRELSLVTGSRFKKIERQAFEDKEEMKQMKIHYDRVIAKLTLEKFG